MDKRVNNVNGTTDNICKCGSWLAHWQTFSGQQIPTYCAEKSCVKTPEVGAHVQKESSSDKSWYIAPLCQEHNVRTGQALILVDSVVLVSASVDHTCGKARYAVG